MPKYIYIYMQYLLPHHMLTAIMGWLAHIRTPRIKNWMIRRFIKKYSVDMSLAMTGDLTQYPDFNRFFIRQLKPQLRPITTVPNAIASPVDGTIAQIGTLNKNQLLQAKGFYFNLETLLGGDTELANTFYNGSFATLYLAPRDYHRVHMPLTGTLTKSIFVPGKLFSVNKMTSEFIPSLYSRNERLITVFDTAAGPMIVILVGAMIVGSIQAIWMDQPIKLKQIQTTTHVPKIHLQTGDELGQFQLGSTVIILFQKNKIHWIPSFKHDSLVQFGQILGKMII